SASSGSWSGSPTSYGYHWQLCNALGEGCLSVAGATRSSYKLGASAVGATMRVIVTAVNAGGSGEATSAASATVIGSAPAAPVNTAVPVISGDAMEGKTLSASTGSWSGSPTSYSYRWQQCNALGQSCLGVSGATGAGYKLAASAVGGTMRVLVTAANAAGSGEAISAFSATVVAAKSEEPKEEKEEEGPITYGTLAHPFAASSVVNTEIPEGAELAPYSATIIKQLDGGNGGGTDMQGAFNFTASLYYATTSTPEENIYQYVGGCSATKERLEPTGWWPDPGDEGHMAVLEPNGVDVETWRGSAPTEKVKEEGNAGVGDYGGQSQAEEEEFGCYKPGEWKTTTLYTSANWQTGQAEGSGGDAPHIPEAAILISQKDLESKRSYW